MNKAELRTQLLERFPSSGAEIDSLLSRFGDGLNVSASIKMRLEKFDGDYTVGKAPVEVIETEDVI